MSTANANNANAIEEQELLARLEALRYARLTGNNAAESAASFTNDEKRKIKELLKKIRERAAANAAAAKAKAANANKKGGKRSRKTKRTSCRQRRKHRTYRKHRKH